MQLSLNFALGREREPQFAPSPTTNRRRLRSGLHCDAILSEGARDLACLVRSYRIGSQVTVWWNPRLKTTAGTADSQRCRIELNPKLVSLGEAVVEQILKHELAHLVAVDRNRNRHIQPHGAEWKRACTDLGIPGERASHSLPIESKHKKPRYAYRCPNCELIVHRQRKMTSGSACLSCCEEYNGGAYHEDFAFQRMAANIRTSA